MFWPVFGVGAFSVPLRGAFSPLAKFRVMFSYLFGSISRRRFRSAVVRAHTFGVDPSNERPKREFCISGD